MKSLLVIFILFGLRLTTNAQNFEIYVPDNDTICLMTLFDCSSKYGKKSFKVKKMNHDDSLHCLKIQHIPLQNSDKVLCIERNFFGDTLGIGLKNEIIVNVQQSIFYLGYSCRLVRSTTTFGEKVNEWFYYHPNGELREIKKY